MKAVGNAADDHDGIDAIESFKKLNIEKNMKMKEQK